MKISVFLEHLLEASSQSGLPLENILETVKSFGIRGVEADAARLDSSLAALLRKKGMEISCVYAFFDFAHGSDSEKIRNILNLMRKNGVKMLMAIPGFFRPEDNREACLAGMLKGMSQLLEAANPDISVCLEDFDDQSAPFSTINGLNGFLTALPALGCAFDTGNFCYSSEDEREAFQRLKGRIVHLHCKDRSRRANRPGEEEKTAIDGTVLFPAAVGEGFLKIEEIVKELLSGGYSGWFAIEHFGSADHLTDIQKSAENLRRWERDSRNGME